MDKIAKLFERISKKDKEQLLEVVDCLANSTCRQTLRAEKLFGSSHFKIRVGNYRIIFHINTNNLAVVDDIRPRNEKTYRGL